MTVVALISILLSIVIVNIQKNREKSRDMARVADLQNIRLALEEYKTACFEYPNKIYTGNGTPASNGRCPAGINFETFFAVSSDR